MERDRKGERERERDSFGPFGPLFSPLFRATRPLSMASWPLLFILVCCRLSPGQRYLLRYPGLSINSSI